MRRCIYRPNGRKGLFDDRDTAAKLSHIGNPLEMILKEVDFEMFRSTLESKMLNQTRKSNARVKPYDVVLMFKILILQRYYCFGDTQIECQISV